MASTLTLEGDGGDLLIELAVNDLGWSRCYLLGERHIYLGAEGADRLLQRLMDAVQDEARNWPPAGEMCGLPVRCALVLSEAHHALYFADAGLERLLFWQDAHQSPVTLAGTTRLSPEQRREWQVQLQAALDADSARRDRPAAVTKEIAATTKIVGGAEALK